MNIKRQMKHMAVFLLMLWFASSFFTSVSAAPGYDRIADTRDMGKTQTVLSYGMTPIYAFDIADGTYRISTVCSSPFFRILAAELMVEDDQMQALLTMSSNSYEYIYPGSAQEAAAEELTAYIPCEENGEGYSFLFPVKALDCICQCAAYSKNTHKWYDRQLVFQSSNLPADAVAFDLPDYEMIQEAFDVSGLSDTLQKDETESTETTSVSNNGLVVLGKNDDKHEPNACETDLPDGIYSIEVTMTGGSGRASVSSPTWYVVKEGHAYAKLLWSSTYYDYMIVDGLRYDNETTDGSNSTFTIPIRSFDEAIEVIADTTAMGDPVEIPYALTFYADSIGSRSMIPQEAAKKVLVIALAVIVIGGILNHYLKKKNRNKKK